MKTILLYAQEELNQIALKAVNGVSPFYAFISWELEVSNDELPQLHVTYQTLDDTKAMIFVSLQGPEAQSHKEPNR